MATPTLEDELTRGQAQWLTLVKFDPGAREFTVGLTHDPESTATQRVAYFVEVQSVTDAWIDRDGSSMEGLLGAHEQKTSSGIRYTLVTDQREITFEAGQRARVADV